MFCKRALASYLPALLIWLSGVGVTLGQEVSPETDPVLLRLDERIRQFMDTVAMGQVQSAYDELLTGSQLLKQERALKELVRKTDAMRTKYGRYGGAEQITAKPIGRDLMLLRYLYKCRDFPVVWYFAFYRSPADNEPLTAADHWRVVSVRFDTDLELLSF
jgi:hypothetical protein